MFFPARPLHPAAAAPYSSMLAPPLPSSPQTMPRASPSSSMAAFIRSRPAVFALLLLCAVALYIGGSHWRAAVPGLAEDDGIVSGKGLGQDADDEMFPSAEEMEALVDDAGVWRGESAREALVQVELGVMSRCPDAVGLCPFHRCNLIV